MPCGFCGTGRRKNRQARQAAGPWAISPFRLLAAILTLGHILLSGCPNPASSHDELGPPIEVESTYSGHTTVVLALDQVSGKPDTLEGLPYTLTVDGEAPGSSPSYQFYRGSTHTFRFESSYYYFAGWKFSNGETADLAAAGAVRVSDPTLPQINVTLNTNDVVTVEPCVIPYLWVSSTTPANGQGDVLRDMPVTIQFTQPIDLSTLAYTLTLSSGENPFLYFKEPGSANNDTALEFEINPVKVPAGTVVTIALEAGIKSKPEAGSLNLSPYTFSYTVGSGVDASPPEMKSLLGGKSEGAWFPDVPGDGTGTDSPEHKADYLNTIALRRFGRGNRADQTGDYRVFLRIHAEDQITRSRGSYQIREVWVADRHGNVPAQQQVLAVSPRMPIPRPGAVIPYTLTSTGGSHDGVVDLEFNLIDENGIQTGFPTVRGHQSDTSPSSPGLPLSRLRYRFVVDTAAPAVELLPGNISVTGADGGPVSWFSAGTSPQGVSFALNPGLAPDSGMDAAAALARDYPRTAASQGELGWYFSFGPIASAGLQPEDFKPLAGGPRFVLPFTPSVGSGKNIPVYAVLRDDLDNRGPAGVVVAGINRDIGKPQVDSFNPVLTPGSNGISFDITVTGTDEDFHDHGDSSPVTGGSGVEEYRIILVHPDNASSESANDTGLFTVSPPSHTGPEDNLFLNTGIPKSGVYTFDAQVKDGVGNWSNLYSEDQGPLTASYHYDGRSPVFKGITRLQAYAGPATSSSEGSVLSLGPRQYIVNQPYLRIGAHVSDKYGSSDPQGTGLTRLGAVYGRYTGSGFQVFEDGGSKLSGPVTDTGAEGQEFDFFPLDDLLPISPDNTKAALINLYAQDGNGNYSFYPWNPPSPRPGPLSDSPPPLPAEYLSAAASIQVYLDTGAPEFHDGSLAAPPYVTVPGKSYRGNYTVGGETKSVLFLDAPSLSINFTARDPAPGGAGKASGLGTFVYGIASPGLRISLATPDPPHAALPLSLPLNSLSFTDAESVSLAGPGDFTAAAKNSFLSYRLEDRLGNQSAPGSLLYAESGRSNKIDYILVDSVSPGMGNLTITAEAPVGIEPVWEGMTRLSGDTPEHDYRDRFFRKAVTITAAGVVEKGSGIAAITLQAPGGVQIVEDSALAVTRGGSSISSAISFTGGNTGRLSITLAPPLRVPAAGDLRITGLALTGPGGAPLADGTQVSLDLTLTDAVQRAGSPRTSNTLWATNKPPAQAAENTAAGEAGANGFYARGPLGFISYLSSGLHTATYTNGPFDLTFMDADPGALGLSQVALQTTGPLDCGSAAVYIDGAALSPGAYAWAGYQNGSDYYYYLSFTSLFPVPFGTPKTVKITGLQWAAAAAEGTYTLSGQIKNFDWVAGETGSGTSGARTVQMVLDRTAPTVAVTEMNAALVDNIIWVFPDSPLAFRLSVDAADSGSGLYQYARKVISTGQNAGDWEPDPQSGEWTAYSSPLDILVPNEPGGYNGNQKIYFYLRDKAGNRTIQWSHAHPFQVDTAPPLMSGSVINGPDVSHSYARGIRYTVNFVEGDSGLKRLEFDPAKKFAQVTGVRYGLAADVTMGAGMALSPGTDFTYTPGLANDRGILEFTVPFTSETGGSICIEGDRGAVEENAYIQLVEAVDTAHRVWSSTGGYTASLSGFSKTVPYDGKGPAFTAPAEITGLTTIGGKHWTGGTNVTYTLKVSEAGEGIETLIFAGNYWDSLSSVTVDGSPLTSSQFGLTTLLPNDVITFTPALRPASAVSITGNLAGTHSGAALRELRLANAQTDALGNPVLSPGFPGTTQVTFYHDTLAPGFGGPVLTGQTGIGGDQWSAGPLTYALTLTEQGSGLSSLSFKAYDTSNTEIPGPLWDTTPPNSLVIIHGSTQLNSGRYTYQPYTDTIVFDPPLAGDGTDLKIVGIYAPGENSGSDKTVKLLVSAATDALGNSSGLPPVAGSNPIVSSLSVDKTVPALYWGTVPGYAGAAVTFTLTVTDTAGLKSLIFADNTFVPTQVESSNSPGTTYTTGSTLPFVWDGAGHTLTLPNHADFRGTYTLTLTGTLGGSDGVSSAITISGAKDIVGNTASAAGSRHISKDAGAPGVSGASVSNGAGNTAFTSDVVAYSLNLNDNNGSGVKSIEFQRDVWGSPLTVTLDGISFSGYTYSHPEKKFTFNDGFEPRGPVTLALSGAHNPSYSSPDAIVVEVSSITDLVGNSLPSGSLSGIRRSIVLDTGTPSITSLTVPPFAPGTVDITLAGVGDAAGLKTLTFGNTAFVPTQVISSNSPYTIYTMGSSPPLGWNTATRTLILPDHDHFRGTGFDLTISGTLAGSGTIAVTGAGDQLGTQDSLSLSGSIAKDINPPSVTGPLTGPAFAPGTVVLTLGGITETAGLKTLTFGDDTFVPTKVQVQGSPTTFIPGSEASAGGGTFTWNSSALTLPDHADFRGINYTLELTGTLSGSDGTKTISITGAGDQLDTAGTLSLGTSVTRDSTAPAITGATLVNAAAGPAGYTAGWVKLTIGVVETGSGLKELDLGISLKQLGNIYVDGDSSTAIYSGAASLASDNKTVLFPPGAEPRPAASLIVYGELHDDYRSSPDTNTNGIAPVGLDPLGAADAVENPVTNISISAAIGYDTTGPAITGTGSPGGQTFDPTAGSPFTITGITVDEDTYGGGGGFDYADSSNYRVVLVTDGVAEKYSTDVSGEITFAYNGGTSFGIRIYGLEAASLFPVGNSESKDITITVGLKNTLGVESFHDWTVSVTNSSSIYAYSYTSGSWGVAAGSGPAIPGPVYPSLSLAPERSAGRGGSSGLGGVFNVIRTGAANGVQAIRGAARDVFSRPPAAPPAPRTGESPAAYYNDPETLRRVNAERAAARTEMIVRRTSRPGETAPARDTGALNTAAPARTAPAGLPSRVPAPSAEDLARDRHDGPAPEPGPSLNGEQGRAEEDGPPVRASFSLSGPGFIPVPVFEIPPSPPATEGEAPAGDDAGAPRLCTLPPRIAEQRTPKPRRRYRRS